MREIWKVVLGCQNDQLSLNKLETRPDGKYRVVPSETIGLIDLCRGATISPQTGEYVTVGARLTTSYDGHYY